MGRFVRRDPFAIFFTSLNWTKSKNDRNWLKTGINCDCHCLLKAACCHNAAGSVKKEFILSKISQFADFSIRFFDTFWNCQKNEIKGSNFVHFLFKLLLKCESVSNRRIGLEIVVNHDDEFPSSKYLHALYINQKIEWKVSCLFKLHSNCYWIVNMLFLGELDSKYLRNANFKNASNFDW